MRLKHAAHLVAQAAEAAVNKFLLNAGVDYDLTSTVLPIEVPQGVPGKWHQEKRRALTNN
jgi:hypothetical protein